METPEGNSSGNSVGLRRRYLRLMTTGMALWLSILPAMLLAEYFGITCYAQIATLLGVVGCVFFFFLAPCEANTF